jgi:Uma2 family endonuclease
MPEHALAAALTHEGPWTEQDYLALPEENRRIELLDGGLLMSPNSANQHQRLLARLWRALDEAIPAELEVLHTVNVRVGPGKILIPDLAVIATPGAELIVNDARAVVMVVEISSPGTIAFDRAVKPQL